MPMESYLNGRFGINYFKHDTTLRSGGVDYKVDAKLQTYDLLFDWYVRPGSAFRLTGGVVYNGSKLDAHATPAGDGLYTINGRRYSAATVGNLRGRVDFRKAAPYLGIGWGNALTPNKGWNLGADLGVIYHGNPHLKLASTGCQAAAAACIVLARDVAAEQARLEEDLKDYKFFPVLRASVSYQF
ncbi:hypothetical protein B0920_08335 [Massilia sp. KIM]|nr:hypothetical protein B0920_08335 [Massilia sp. KIM]